MYQDLTKQANWLQCLTSHQLEGLTKHTNKAIFANNDLIIKQNSRSAQILLLTEGIAKMHMETRKGKYIIVKLCKGGNFLGIDEILNNKTNFCSYSAVTPVSVYYIDLRYFLQLLEDNHDFAKKIMIYLTEENHFLISRLAALTYKQLPGKLADILLYFSQEIFKNNSFNLPISRQELAEFSGTTKESLIRTLTEFKNDKLITVQGKNITIVSQQIIETLSKLG
jgi:cAMP-binding proteins - catabolite gene activator and regulatory subunit of cAMP-dependent protein kinases